MKLSDFYYSKVQYPIKENNKQKKCNSFVYVIFNKDIGLFKIGITNSPHERFQTIKSSSGSSIWEILQIELEYDYDESSIMIEKIIHKYYKDKRIIGEYFLLSIRDIIEIQDLFYSIEGCNMTFFDESLINRLMPYVGYW